MFSPRAVLSAIAAAGEANPSPAATADRSSWIAARRSSPSRWTASGSSGSEVHPSDLGRVHPVPAREVGEPDRFGRDREELVTKHVAEAAVRRVHDVADDAGDPLAGLRILTDGHERG